MWVGNIISITNNIISAHWRFLDFHGEINARLNRNEAIYHGNSHKRSFLIIALSPLLFRAPQRYLTELEEAWIDEHILEPVWKSLMTKILGEWSDLILWVSEYFIFTFYQSYEIVTIVNSYALSKCGLSCHTWCGSNQQQQPSNSKSDCMLLVSDC